MGNFNLIKSLANFYPEFLKHKTRFNQSNLIISVNQKNFDII